jgi:hypothetical protein
MLTIKLKKMKFKIFILLSSVAVLAAGCKKSWLDVNKNPNQLTGTISPSFIFTAALSTTVANEVDQNEIGSYWAGQWTQSSSYIFSATTFAYQFTNSNFNYWDPIFNNLEDYQNVINNADAMDQPFLKGPAQVMKAYLFQKLVDMYGDVPYSEALKGIEKLFPKFDNQKAVYEALIPLLDTAIANIKANAFTGAFSSADIALGASQTKWVKFANTLKLRILIRQDRIPGRDAYIVSNLQKIIAEGSGFLGAGQDVGVNPGYTAADTRQNPFYDRWGYSAAGAQRSLGRYPRPTKYLFDVLIAANDTFRLKRMAYAKGGENPNNAGVSTVPEIVSNYVGVPYGAPSGYTAPSTSWIGPAVLTKGKFNLPLYLMTAAEAQFLLAEAAYKYGSSVTFASSAQEYFELGIRESFRLLGVPDAATKAATLYNSGIDMFSWTASPDKLKAIWMQKWLALVDYEGFEAWCEVRRTNWPPIPLSAGAPTSQKVPVRLFYPNTELGSNQANTPVQAATVVFDSRLFWDVD